MGWGQISNLKTGDHDARGQIPDLDRGDLPARRLPVRTFSKNRALTPAQGSPMPSLAPPRRGPAHPQQSSRDVPAHCLRLDSRQTVHPTFRVMQMLLAELLGTTLLVLLGSGVVTSVGLNRTKGQNSGWIVITVGWGVADAMAVYAVGRNSGAHLKPAVTLAPATIGSFPWGGCAWLPPGAVPRRVLWRSTRPADVPA